MPKVINTNNFAEETANGVVVVDFYATWCGPCKMLAPVFEELEKDMDGQAKFVKIDIDESMEIARKYMVSSVPTVMIFKDGKTVDTMVGFKPKDALKASVQNHL